MTDAMKGAWSGPSADAGKMRRSASGGAGRFGAAALRLLAAALLLTAAGCGGRASRPAAESPARYVFHPATAPAELSAAQRRDFLRDHYWDTFDFADTLLLARADTMQLAEAFIHYAMLLGDRPGDGAPMAALMGRASRSRPMLDYFAMLAEEVLHDPNSPLRNEELYIPVLQARLAAPWYDEYERIAIEYDLRMALRNRVGAPAEDFVYTLPSGARGSLYGLEADYVLLFITNPGCPACREVTEAVKDSPMLSELIDVGRLRVLTLYPDADLDAWRAHLEEFPAGWINARDAGCRLSEEGLYDLRAIPSLYLLDHEKRVVVRDAADVAIVEEAIDRRL